MNVHGFVVPRFGYQVNGVDNNNLGYFACRLIEDGILVITVNTFLLNLFRFTYEVIFAQERVCWVGLEEYQYLVYGAPYYGAHCSWIIKDCILITFVDDFLRRRR